MSETDGMRVLIVCVPQAGHVRPMLPLATALASGDAEVLVASGPGARDIVTGAGLAFRSVGPDLDVWFDRLAERTRGRPGRGLSPEHVERYFVPRLFAEVGLDAMLDGLDEAVRDFSPDLLVYEPFSFAAPLVAALHAVPAVRHTIGLPLDPLVVDLASDAVTPAWRAAGLATPTAAGSYDGPTLDICPPTLVGAAHPSAFRVQPLRPAPLPDRTAELPVTLPYGGRPLVYVTLGTFANSDLDLFRLILAALAALPVNVLVTAGDDAAAAALGKAPANAVVAGFVPQAAILPHCAAVLHHAGAGTTFGLLAHGLPSVALPQSADNFSIARRLGSARAAAVLMPGEVTVDSVRAAARQVLADPAYRRGAERIAAEIAAMPGPADVAATLRPTTTREEALR
jgi:glycosyltransferase, MGT family